MRKQFSIWIDEKYIKALNNLLKQDKINSDRPFFGNRSSFMEEAIEEKLAKYGYEMARDSHND